VKLAWRELVRRPSRFLTAGGALTLIVILLLLLGGLLDGLYLSATAAIRAQSASVIVYSADSRDSLIRSRIESATRARVEAVDVVESVSGFGVVLLGAQMPGGKLVDTALFGYEAANSKVPAPPPSGRVYADHALEDDGVQLGDVLLIGPARTPVTVEGWVEDTSYLYQGGLWAEADTWRQVLAENRPDQVLGAGTFQALLVTPHLGVPDRDVADAIDAAVPGVSALTTHEAILSLPPEKNPMIAAPLRLHDCSLVTDGAAALVVMRREDAEARGGRSVEIAGLGQANERIALSKRSNMHELLAGKEAVRRAYLEAGVSAGDVDLAEVHDCFTINQLLSTEALGLSADGRAGHDYLAGRFGRDDGQVCVNLSGGLKAKGHPVGATGVSMHALLYKQLVGEPIGAAPERFDPEIGVAFNVGGSAVTNCATVLRRRR